MTEQSITKQIGEPIKVNFRNPKAIGSTGFYLKSFIAKNSENKSLKLDSKCNFEKRTGGILLRSNYSNTLAAIPIPKESIIRITLKRGKENIKPFFLSPMWILLKLGVSIVYARYFKLMFHEYSIGQMKLKVETTKYEMDFIANGYLFERQLSFFESLGYDDKLNVEIQGTNR